MDGLPHRSGRPVTHVQRGHQRLSGDLGGGFGRLVGTVRRRHPVADNRNHRAVLT
jgi:hypothetical protein